MNANDRAGEWQRRYTESTAAEEKSLEARGLKDGPALSGRFIGSMIFFVGGGLYWLVSSGNPWLIAVAGFVLTLAVLGGLVALKNWTAKRRSPTND